MEINGTQHEFRMFRGLNVLYEPGLIGQMEDGTGTEASAILNCGMSDGTIDFSSGFSDIGITFDQTKGYIKDVFSYNIFDVNMALRRVRVAFTDLGEMLVYSSVQNKFKQVNDPFKAGYATRNWQYALCANPMVTSTPKKQSAVVYSDASPADSNSPAYNDCAMLITGHKDASPFVWNSQFDHVTQVDVAGNKVYFANSALAWNGNSAWDATITASTIYINGIKFTFSSINGAGKYFNIASGDLTQINVTDLIVSEPRMPSNDARIYGFDPTNTGIAHFYPDMFGIIGSRLVIGCSASNSHAYSQAGGSQISSTQYGIWNYKLPSLITPTPLPTLPTSPIRSRLSMLRGTPQAMWVQRNVVNFASIDGIQSEILDEGTGTLSGDITKMTSLTSTSLSTSSGSGMLANSLWCMNNNDSFIVDGYNRVQFIDPVTQYTLDRFKMQLMSQKIDPILSRLDFSYGRLASFNSLWVFSAIDKSRDSVYNNTTVVYDQILETWTVWEHGFDTLFVEDGALYGTSGPQLMKILDPAVPNYGNRALTRYWRSPRHIFGSNMKRKQLYSFFVNGVFSPGAVITVTVYYGEHDGGPKSFTFDIKADGTSNDSGAYVTSEPTGQALYGSSAYGFYPFGYDDDSTLYGEGGVKRFQAWKSLNTNICMSDVTVTFEMEQLGEVAKIYSYGFCSDDINEIPKGQIIK